jgi:hypothetical protein
VAVVSAIRAQSRHAIDTGSFYLTMNPSDLTVLNRDDASGAMGKVILDLLINRFVSAG